MNTCRVNHYYILIPLSWSKELGIVSYYPLPLALPPHPPPVPPPVHPPPPLLIGSIIPSSSKYLNKSIVIIISS
jgi:hypothetical protein